MQPIIIHIQQGHKECDVRIDQLPDGRNEINIKFFPGFPIESNTLYERIAAAVFSEAKKEE